MNISHHTSTGWGRKTPNTSKTHCDIDGAKLWQGPGGGLYCDRMHSYADAEPGR